MDNKDKTLEKQLKDLKSKPISEQAKKSIDEKMRYVNKPVNKR